jgi:hypothetical protein
VANSVPTKGWIILEGRAGVWKHDPQEKKLGSLTGVEAVVNDYAKKFAKKHRVGEDQFTIVLTTKFKGIMGLKRGPVVQIILLWPDAQPNINTLLDSAFKTISRNKLVDGFAVESVLHIKKRAEERKKWLREKIGADEADIILDLIPKHRVKVTVTTTVKYEDVITGEALSITHEAKPEQYRGTDVASWLKLSRIVRDNHPEEATRYAPQASEPEGNGVVGADEGSGDRSGVVGTIAGASEVPQEQGESEVALGDDGEEHDVGDTHSVAG